MQELLEPGFLSTEAPSFNASIQCKDGIDMAFSVYYAARGHKWFSRAGGRWYGVKTGDKRKMGQTIVGGMLLETVLAVGVIIA